MVRARPALLGRRAFGVALAAAVLAVACGGAAPKPAIVVRVATKVAAVRVPEPTKPPAPAPPPAAPRCPDEMALVEGGGGYACIDRYEASLVVVDDDGTTTPWHFSRSVDKVHRVLRAVPAKGVKPQVNVSELQASAACGASGKRLCRLAEWTAACRGPTNNLYPYGPTYRFGACNAGRPSPVAAARREAARGVLKLHDPRIAERDNTVMSGGAHPLCVTKAGVYDLHGNVHEWIADTPKPRKPFFGTFMGGFFADGSLNGEGCLYKTTAHSKEYHDYSTGFRCCKDADARSEQAD